ncbi:hypothetical protein CHH28_02130 [Bacterioplanes sanyensis]|uniref:N-acetyltransferase domain-containing protein n=1 Tax=Bacterioplanes sanyensis TaxID=1249553 RepID=A0A222FH25_9GAMM|nr:hypothetical protein [Bacterioplanes sanyensis]ASP37543.1 hypothetical protein CHH28_02130 [Bacterioplanes sanyensis]
MKQYPDFLLIEQPQQLQPVFSSLMHLLELSAADDAILGLAEPMTDAQHAGWLRDLSAQLEEGILKILIAVDATGEVCLCCMLKGSRQDTTRHIYDLQKGFIRADLRKTGLLPKAMLKIAQIARNNGVDVLTLDVRGGTPAHSLWKAIGFKTYGILNDYSRRPDRRRPGSYVSFAGYYMSITTDALLEQFGMLEELAESVG